MRILVTGGAGYIGSHICVELLNNGYEVVIVDSLVNSKYEVLNRIRKITNRDFIFYKVDLIEQDRVDQIFAENNIDAVIHLAGLKSVNESIDTPILYYKNNIISTLTLCDAMQRYNIKKIVFSSSATVYGNPYKMPISEDSPLCAKDPYGRTKLIIEDILYDIYKSDNRWGISLLRYFNPIGAHKSGEIGEDPNGIPNNLMPYITQVAVGRREKLSVFGSDYNTHDGTGIRDYIHVVDIAIGHIKALEKVMSSIGVEAYNLGTGIGYSVLDVIRSFEKATGKHIPYILTERRSGDVDKCYADVKKALENLGWKADMSLEDMCRDAWKWQMNNPDGYRNELISEIAMSD